MKTVLHFIRDHQLASAFIALFVVFQVIAGILRPDPFSADHWSSLFMGASDGCMTGFFLIWLGERLREKGSDQGLD